MRPERIRGSGRRAGPAAEPGYLPLLRADPFVRRADSGAASGWSKSLEVTADGAGIVSHAGLALLRLLAGKTGLTGGLSRALASPRLLIHDRGRVTADLACAIADGSEVISDFRVLTDQKELFGLVASVPTANTAVHMDAT
jgi:hypothetical protein